MPPTREASTGTPCAMASSTTSGKVSASVGKMKRSVRASAARIVVVAQAAGDDDPLVRAGFPAR